MAAPISNYLIPLTNDPQTFSIDLANTTYTLTVKWNPAPDAGWILDIADSVQNPIACGLPFVTGADILSGLSYLGIQGALIAFTTGKPDAVPTFDNLGTDSNLYFQTDVPNNGG